MVSARGRGGHEESTSYRDVLSVRHGVRAGGMRRRGGVGQRFEQCFEQLGRRGDDFVCFDGEQRGKLFGKRVICKRVFRICRSGANRP